MLWGCKYVYLHFLDILNLGMLQMKIKSSSSIFYYPIKAKTIHIDITALYFSLTTPIPSNINPCLPIFVRGFATVWKIPHEISTAATAFQIEISKSAFKAFKKIILYSESKSFFKCQMLGRYFFTFFCNYLCRLFYSLREK